MQTRRYVAGESDPGEGEVGETLEYQGHGDRVRGDEGEEGGEQRLAGNPDKELPLHVFEPGDQSTEDHATARATEAAGDVVESCCQGFACEHVADLLWDQVGQGEVHESGHEDENQ